ncbi:MAG: Asp23/Gls24 family envelope stress response protein [Clostridia bacterium]|nr:Asp23/Gls24 family envelope stress response protein [Clostridia bacterium]
MASKKDILPVNIEEEVEQNSSITYAPEVISIITGAAINEVEGIAGMSNSSGGMFSRKNAGNSKGIKIELGPEEVSIDLYVVVEYDRPIQKVAMDVQENVRKAIENMTGLHVVRVDVHVQGVSFEKENTALASGAKKAESLTEGQGDESAQKAVELVDDDTDEEEASEDLNDHAEDAQDAKQEEQDAE